MISNLICMDGGSIALIVVLLVLFVGMMAISVIPQKKKQREYAEMQNALKVGTRIMTIGRLVGTIVAINTDNTLEVDIGAKGSPVIIVINREGVGLNLDAQIVAPGSKGDIKTNAAEGDVDAEEEAPTPEELAAPDGKASGEETNTDDSI